MKTLLLSGLTALLLSPVAMAGDPIAVGQAAPPLPAMTWVKGEPVARFEPGHIYVLDFWATWCGPCKKSIPHINALAQKHRDDKVSVIGLAVWPRDGMVPTKDFVTEKGAEMDYLIAEDIGGQTAELYMNGSLSQGIPTVMIVDREGQIAWVGNPLDPPGAMDEAFAQILAGTQDKAAFAAADQARRDEVRSSPDYVRNQKYGRVSKAAKAKDWPVALAAVDELLAGDPTDLTAVQFKYRILGDSGDRAGAQAFGMAQVSGPLKDQAEPLNALAWMIVDPRAKLAPADRDLDLALAAAIRADELTKHENASIIDTLARTHFWKGDVSKAIELQKQAVALASAEERTSLQSALSEYEKAAAAKPAGS